MPLVRYRVPKIARLDALGHMSDYDWKINHVVEADQVAAPPRPLLPGLDSANRHC